MSPRYIQNMMMFKSFMTSLFFTIFIETKPSFNPVMLRIYGKLNAERELFNNEEQQNKTNIKRRLLKKPKITYDDKVLLLIQKDFERETK